MLLLQEIIVVISRNKKGSRCRNSCTNHHHDDNSEINDGANKDTLANKTTSTRNPRAIKSLQSYLVPSESENKQNELDSDDYEN